MSYHGRKQNAQMRCEGVGIDPLDPNTEKLDIPKTSSRDNAYIFITCHPVSLPYAFGFVAMKSLAIFPAW
jgi:hypothetical protein